MVVVGNTVGKIILEEGLSLETNAYVWCIDVYEILLSIVITYHQLDS